MLKVERKSNPCYHGVICSIALKQKTIFNLNMATAVLAHNSYRIAKSWQCQDTFPDSSSENFRGGQNGTTSTETNNAIQGNHIQP